jgi:hypothetical protein
MRGNFPGLLLGWASTTRNHRSEKSKSMNKPLTTVIIATAIGLNARAQIGSGWTQKTYSERLEYHHTGGPEIETISPAPSSFSDSYIAYSKSSNLRTFTFKNTTAGRVEIRVNNDYTSGQHQFEGYLNFSKPSSMLSDWAQTFVMQDFGAATHAAWKLNVQRSGSLHYEHGTLISSSVFGQTHRLNLIHNMGNHTIQVYVDGSKKVDTADDGGTSHYTKYGMYGGHVVTHDTWNNVKLFVK